MPFRFKGVPLSSFLPLFGLSDGELAKRNARRITADEKPGFPCRVTLEDAEPGESLLLLPYDHHRAHSPYRASGPIFVRERAQVTFDDLKTPPVLRHRLLSVRAYDRAGMMIDADVVSGDNVEPLIVKFFEHAETHYLHVHNARRGCFACCVERAEHRR